MSSSSTHRIYKIINIDIDIISKEKIIEIEDAVKECLIQKLKKINIILKQLYVSEYNKHLFVHDRYCVATDLVEIARAFGMHIKEVNTSKKGKCYIISDHLIMILEILQTKYQLVKDIVNAEVDDEIKRVVDDNAFDFTKENDATNCILEAIRSLKEKGVFSIKGQKTITITERDGYVEDKVEEIKSDKENIENGINEFFISAKKQIDENNANMQNGTTQLICSRAKQMGYEVKKEQKGNEIQLVLVRLE